MQSVNPKPVDTKPIGQTQPAKPYISRRPPAKICRQLEEKHHGCCVFPGCNKPAAHRHHTKRYGLHKGHDVNHIVPLCKHHHDLAHAGLIENEQESPRLWRLRDLCDEAPWWDENNIIDQRVQSYKQIGQLQLDTG